MWKFVPIETSLEPYGAPWKRKKVHYSIDNNGLF